MLCLAWVKNILLNFYNMFSFIRRTIVEFNSDEFNERIKCDGRASFMFESSKYFFMQKHFDPSLWIYLPTTYIFHVTAIGIRLRCIAVSIFSTRPLACMLLVIYSINLVIAHDTSWEKYFGISNVSDLGVNMCLNCIIEFMCK
jgi:hypothetical protein